MRDEGVIHEIVMDHLMDRVFHVELRCLPCIVEPSSEEAVRTRLWMSKDHLRRVLDLISVAANKRLVCMSEDEVDLAALAKAAANTSDRNKVDVLQDEVVRVACLFRSDPWAAQRPKLLIRRNHGFKKYYLHGETVVASVALVDSQQSEEQMSKTLYQEIGVKFDLHEPSGEPKNSLSKYFQVVN